MPIQRKLKQAQGESGQDKKHGRYKKISKLKKDESHEEFTGYQITAFQIRKKVNQQEIHGVKVSTRVLEQLTSQEVRDLRTVFEIFDFNSDGFLSSVDLWRALRTLGFKISRDKASQVIHDVNFEERRKIKFTEFLEIVVDRQGDARDTHGEIMKGFEMFDLDGTGGISIEKLHQVCRKAGIKFTRKELEDMIEEADVNGDGFVDQSEFLRIMLQTNLF